MDTDSKLREKIDLIIAKVRGLSVYCYDSQFADQILALTDVHYKEKFKGYKSPEEVSLFLSSITEETLKKARIGYVQLDEDQTPLTIYPSQKETDYNQGFTDGERKMAHDMREEKWRKVKL